MVPQPEDFSNANSNIQTPMKNLAKPSIPSLMTNFIRPSRAILAAALFAVGSGSVLADTVIYQDLFTTPGTNSGGVYTSSLGGTAPTTCASDGITSYASSSWTFNAETGGWGQTGAGYATPTSSNYLPFTPRRGRVYVLTATIDATNWSNGEWFTIGFTQLPSNWVPGNFVADLGSNLVRGGQSKTVSVSLDTRAAGWTDSQGLAYVGWFTDMSGNANLNPAVQQVKVSNFSLVIQNPCAMTYDGNGADGGSAPADGNVYSSGATVTVPGNTGGLVRTNYNFNGWNTAADGSGTAYTPASSFTVSGNTALYAQWSPANILTVTYSGNGNTDGTVPTDSNSPYLLNATVTVLGNTGNLSKSGCLFNNWNTEMDGSGTTYGASNTFDISSNVTLYAQWRLYDVTWNNGANTGNWNTVDANWNGSVWSNTMPNNAVFDTVGGNVALDVVTAGSVNVGNISINFPSSHFTGTSLTASSLTVQGDNINGGGYGTNPTLTLDVATVTIAGDMAVGRANLVVGSGKVTVDRIVTSAASADWGRLAIAGGTVTATNGVDGSVHSGATFALDLNGGELRTPALRVADREVGTNNSAWLNFNGGTLTAIGADNADFITLYGGSQNTFVAGDGAIINSNGRNLGIHPNLMAAATGNGGLTKLGAGTLTLHGSNTYRGNTTVAPGGALVLAGGGSTRFYPAANGVSNMITGSGSPSVTLDGEIYLDLSGANTTSGNSWLLVDSANLAFHYGGTLSVNSSLGAFASHSGRWQLVSGTNIWTFTEATGTLTLASDAFTVWMATHWPGLTDKTPTGDPDSDGLSNLMEYAFGTNPRVSSAAQIVYDGTSVTTPGTPKMIEEGGMYYAVFGRRADYLTAGLSYTVEFSADLENGYWVTSTVDPEPITATGEILAVRVPYPGLIDSAQGPQKARFFRVGVSQTTP